MLVFVGALWGAIVFPVISSFYWNRVSEKAFTSAVISALVLFTIARFELVPIQGAIAVFFEIFATLGAGVVLGLMGFGFFGRRFGIALGALVAIGLLPFSIGFLRDYHVLLSSLTAYGVSTAVCVVITMLGNERFDFDLISERVTAFQSR
jgi:hypothetical protein